MSSSKNRTGAPSNLSPTDPRRGRYMPEHQVKAIARRAKLNGFGTQTHAPAKGPRLLNCIQKELDTRSDNEYLTRREKAAMAYVDEMEAGSFAHHKEILDREEGKVPSRMATADGIPLKAFIAMPLEGDDAP